MISSAELQYEYTKLYALLREYLWPIDIIEVISDLEVACYTAFPDMNKVKSAFGKLRKATKEIEKEDEDLKKRLESFQTLLDGADGVYCKLNSVQEVVNDESVEE